MASAATSGSVSPAVVPPVPLCQRPPVHESSVAALLAWRDDVLARVTEIGDTFEQQDNGPSRDELTVCTCRRTRHASCFAVHVQHILVPMYPT